MTRWTTPGSTSPRAWTPTPPRSVGGGRGHRTSVVTAVVGAVVALSSCGADEQPAVEPTQAEQSPVEQAQAAVTAQEEVLAAAQQESATAEAAFCTTSETYVVALDRYGDVLNDTAPTVGDVTTAGDDLVQPQQETLAAGEAVVDARGAVDRAEVDLAIAQADLAAAEALAAGTTPAPSVEAPVPTSTPVVPAATVTRVEQAEAELATAREGITDQTPLAQAAEQFNAAVVALEMAWLQLVAQSGCLPDDQQEEAVAAARDYTVALQQELAAAGYYGGEIDGVYGPQTVEAVEAVQAESDLPQTGTVDRATEAALQAQADAVAGAAAQQQTASTAALQQTLALAGYWDGPIDGQWSDELTAALSALQTDLGVPVTGTVDALTVAAFQAAVASATAEATPSPSPPAPAPTRSPEPPTPPEPTTEVSSGGD